VNVHKLLNIATCLKKPALLFLVVPFLVKKTLREITFVSKMYTCLKRSQIQKKKKKKKKKKRRRKKSKKKI
jgi:hypothetical protein